MPNETDGVIKVEIPRLMRFHGTLVNLVCYGAFGWWGYIMFMAANYWALVPVALGIVLTWLSSNYEDMAIKYYTLFQVLKAATANHLELSEKSIVQKESADDEQETDPD